MLKIGITGRTGSGKSTIFSALTQKESTYTMEPDVGVVSIPDKRLDFLASMFGREKIVYETLEFVDAKGEKNLLKAMDLFILVIPSFGSFKEPDSYLEELEEEFIVEDAILCEQRCKKIKKSTKEEFEGELELLERLKRELESANPLRNIDLKPREYKTIRGFAFLSIKPCIALLNIDESKLGKPLDIPSINSITVIPTCGELEKEVVQTGDDEELRNEFGLGEPLVRTVFRESYNKKNIITFYTVVGKEARAWNIEEGTTAVEAAERIHSDIAHGFIKGQVVSFDDLKEAGSLNRAKEQGKVRLEGKEHKVNDGDVIEFRFNV